MRPEGVRVKRRMKRRKKPRWNCTNQEWWNLKGEKQDFPTQGIANDMWDKIGRIKSGPRGKES
jgi:hypothetical protein